MTDEDKMYFEDRVIFEKTVTMLMDSARIVDAPAQEAEEPQEDAPAQPKAEQTQEASKE